MLFITEKKNGLLFKVFVQPKSSKNSIIGAYKDGIKIKLTAPPVNNAANKLCIKILSKKLKISKSNITIYSGETSRTKHILILPQNIKKDIREIKQDLLFLYFKKNT